MVLGGREKRREEENRTEQSREKEKSTTHTHTHTHTHTASHYFHSSSLSLTYRNVLYCSYLSDRQGPPVPRFLCGSGTSGRGQTVRTPRTHRTCVPFPMTFEYDLCRLFVSLVDYTVLFDQRYLHLYQHNTPNIKHCATLMMYYRNFVKTVSLTFASI